MAKKQNTRNTNTGGTTPPKAPATPKQPVRNATPAAESSFMVRNASLLIISGISLLTFLFFKSILDNQLTNWDDLGYIITNPLIKDSSTEGIKNIFSINHPVMGNYHPLTILIYMIEYSYYGLEPWIYHFNSLIAHILVTIAVFYFVKRLTGRLVAASVVALLFGIHPMHVESVAWAAGRKDLLYGLFFVLSLTAYVNYIRGGEGKKAMWYISTILLFTLSLLCKSVAVTLPVTFFAIDFFEKRKWSFKLIIEKIPHFGLSVLFGVLSVMAQKDVGALGSLDAKFSPFERMALGCYALSSYLGKALVPVGLSNFYPYPLKEADALPGVYYSYVAIVLALAAAIWFFARRNKVVLFGFAFFIINIVLLLQFIPVGGAIMSDRYGYIPYLGLFFIIGWAVSEFFEDQSKVQTGKIVLGAVIAYCLVLGYAASERCKDWYDSISLWRDNAEKHPEAPVAYFYAGQEYYTRFEAAATANERKIYGDSSLYLFNMSVQRKPNYINPIICIAELQRTYGQIDAAKETYYRAMKINDKNESVYLGLGVVYSIKQQYDSAAPFFRKALSLKAYFPEGHSNYANFLDIVGKTDSSLIEYEKAIAQNPDVHIPYLNRARIYLRLNKPDMALADYNRVIALKPEMGEAYYLRARVLAQQGNKAGALADANKAVSLGYTQVDQAFYNGLK